MAMRLGELLVSRGILTPAQVDRIMATQAATGRPFGELAEALHGVSPRAVEEAWAAQLAQITERFDPRRDTAESTVHDLVSRRQAWQFGVLPVRRERGFVVIATTEALLPRAARFLAWHLAEPVYFLIADHGQLESSLSAHYPLPGARLASVGPRGHHALPPRVSDLAPVVRIVHPDRPA